MAAPIADVLRELRKLADRAGRVEATDAQLLQRFTSRQDETAFEELLARHGPMVLNVCQRLLHGHQEAEDAFQATFLVLVRRAGSIGQADRVASWLYGVAHRVARRVSVQRARRRRMEQPGVELVAVEPYCQIAWDDIQPVIHEELNRLPERYRTAIVLCALEGQSQDEAAAYLRCSPGAIKGRLERGRNLLRKRLTRRGLALSAPALMMVVAAPANAVPPLLVAVTMKAAIQISRGGGSVVGAASSETARLVEGVLKTMFVAKLKIAGIISVAVSVLGFGTALSVHGLKGADSPATTRVATDDTSGPPVIAKDDQKPAPKTNPSTALPQKVRVAQPISRTVTEYGVFTGRTEATTAEIRSSISGTVVKVDFTPGADAKKGDVLFELDPRALQAELAKANAELARAEARLAHATRQIQQRNAQAAAGRISPEDLEKAVAEKDDAMAALKVAQAGRETVQLQLQSAKIVAPFNGRVGRSSVAPGSFVTAGATILTTLVATDAMHVGFDIDERTFLRLQRDLGKTKGKLVGATVQFGFAHEDNFSHRATVDFVANEFDPRTGTIHLRAVASGANETLLPGLFVRVRLPVGERQAVLLPDGVQVYPGQSRILVVSPENVVESRNATFQWLDCTKYLLPPALMDHVRDFAPSLKPTDWVIIEAGKELKPGMTVQPERSPSPARATTPRQSNE